MSITLRTYLSVIKHSTPKPYACARTNILLYRAAKDGHGRCIVTHAYEDFKKMRKYDFIPITTNFTLQRLEKERKKNCYTLCIYYIIHINRYIVS